MNLHIIITQLLGIIATFFYLLSDIQKDDKKLDLYYTIGNSFFLFHLLMIKSFFSAITVFLAVVRNITISKFKQKWIKLFFISLFIFIFILALFKADNWQECLPAVVSLIMTYAFIYTKKHILTFLIGLCSILWLIVGYAIGSYPIILLEILSILLLIYRAFRQKNKK